MRLSHLAVVLFILAFIGFGDATFLTMEHYRGVAVPCLLVTGCATVTTSDYSTILSVPVSLLGLLYYLLVVIGAVIYLDTRKEHLLHLTAAVTPLGFLFSLWFLYVQAFILHAFCTWCLLSAVTSISLFVVGVMILRHHPTIKEKIAGLFN